MSRERYRQKPEIGTGMPQTIALETFGGLLFDAFGEMPYQVGSSVRGKEWRDVDVRVMLDPRLFRRLFGEPQQASLNPRWRAVCWAFAVLGERITGLPIDFQLQDRADANERYPDGWRQPIGLCLDAGAPASPLMHEVDAFLDKWEPRVRAALSAAAGEGIGWCIHCRKDHDSRDCPYNPLLLDTMEDGG